MNPIQCRYAPLAGLPIARAETAQLWLSSREGEVWSQLKSDARRQTFLEGRIVAKRLIFESILGQPNVAASNIEINSRSAETELGVAPKVSFDGERLELHLSIAHTARGVLVAISTDPLVNVGIDLVDGPFASKTGLDWCFNDMERNWLAADPTRRAEQLWAMKEALFKAGHAGEGFAPWRIAVAAIPNARVQCWRVDGQTAALATVRNYATASISKPFPFTPRRAVSVAA